MICGKALQSLKRIVNHQEIGFLQAVVGGASIVFHHKVSHALRIELWNIVMSVIVFCANGKKQGFLRIVERARVGEQLAHTGIFTTQAHLTRGNDVGNLFNRIYHVLFKLINS